MSGAFTGMERLSMEQVMLINPDVIVTLDFSFASGVYKNPLWQDIKAIKEKLCIWFLRDR